MLLPSSLQCLDVSIMIFVSHCLCPHIFVSRHACCLSISLFLPVCITQCLHLYLIPQLPSHQSLPRSPCSPRIAPRPTLAASWEAAERSASPVQTLAARGSGDSAVKSPVYCSLRKKKDPENMSNSPCVCNRSSGLCSCLFMCKWNLTCTLSYRGVMDSICSCPVFQSFNRISCPTPSPTPQLSTKAQTHVYASASRSSFSPPPLSPGQGNAPYLTQMPESVSWGCMRWTSVSLSAAVSGWYRSCKRLE